jgi:hypothetical protein
LLNCLQRHRLAARVPDRASTALRTPRSETYDDHADTLPDIDGYEPEPEAEPDEETLLQAILREFETGGDAMIRRGRRLSPPKRSRRDDTRAPPRESPRR